MENQEQTTKVDMIIQTCLTEVSFGEKEKVEVLGERTWYHSLKLKALAYVSFKAVFFFFFLHLLSTC